MRVTERSNSVFVTRYMGSKSKLLDKIVPEIRKLLDSRPRVVDLMAGTHSVGYALKREAQIFANDIQHYSAVVGRALVINNSVPNLSLHIEDIKSSFHELSTEPGWFSETYAETYFSFDQCRDIERIRMIISAQEDQVVSDLLMCSLFYAMSLCQSSPGHFAQYMPSNHPRIEVLRNMSIWDSFIRKAGKLSIDMTTTRNEIFCSDVFELLESEIELPDEGAVAYLDPPYTSAQYSRFYHLLETVTLDDTPLVSHKGLYREGRHQSRFCSKRQVDDAFVRIVRACADRRWPLVVSYSSHGLIELSRLEELCEGYYQNVKLLLFPYSHSTQGKGILRDRNEVLLVCSV
jgi:adenine-specific DNA methylase